MIRGIEYDMSKTPFLLRRNLVSECARVLRERMDAGHWGSELPGERKLAEELQIGRDTVRAALETLERKGVVSAPVRGHGRKILRRNGQGLKEAELVQVGLLTFATPENASQSFLLEIGRIQQLLTTQGRSLIVDSPRWYRSAGPEVALGKYVKEKRCGFWILHRPPVEVQRAVERMGLPCLVRGEVEAGVKLPSVEVDWEAAVRHATGLLWRKGHRRVGLLVSSDRWEQGSTAVQGFRAFGEKGFSPRVIEEDGSTVGMRASLAASFQRKDPPTALIARCTRQAVTAMQWLAQHKHEVPRHVSVMCLEHEAALDWMVPKVSRYVMQPEKVARMVLRQMEKVLTGGRRAIRATHMMPQFIAGDSVGKCG